MPIEREHAVIQCPHLRCEPTGNVDSVRNVADGDFVFRSLRPQTSPHAAADDTMQVGNGVGSTTAFEGKHRHTKGFVSIIRIDTPQANQASRSQSKLIRNGAEMFFKEIPLKSVMSGGDRRMCRETTMPNGFQQGIFEGLAIVLHPHADEFEGCES